MIKTARQLKDLIRNLSKSKSADAQILMRNYIMERVLECISLSEYRDKFILKGGMLARAYDKISFFGRFLRVCRAISSFERGDDLDVFIYNK